MKNDIMIIRFYLLILFNTSLLYPSLTILFFTYVNNRFV